jgi:hypothetical protein
MSMLNDTIYARPQNVVTGRSAFSKEDLTHLDIIEDLVIGSLKARHIGYNFVCDKSKYMDDMAKHFSVFVCTEAFTITNDDTHRSVDLNVGDYIAFPSECHYSTKDTKDHYIYFDVYYWPAVEVKKFGDTSYKIVATLTDKYEIDISANSEKEAYDKAYNAPLSDWKHLTPGGISKPRKIIRWAEWGDFKIN